MCHVFVRSDSLCGVLVSDHEYPQRVGQTLLSKVSVLTSLGYNLSFICCFCIRLLIYKVVWILFYFVIYIMYHQCLVSLILTSVTDCVLILLLDFNVSDTIAYVMTMKHT